MIGAAAPRPRLTKATNRSLEPLDFLPRALLLFHSSGIGTYSVRPSPPDQAGRRIPDQSTIGAQPASVVLSTTLYINSTHGV